MTTDDKFRHDFLRCIYMYAFTYANFLNSNCFIVKYLTLVGLRLGLVIVTTIFEDKHFRLILEEDQVSIQVYQPGLVLKDFQSVLQIHPRIELKNFTALQQAFQVVSDELVPIGIWKPLVECEITSDLMEARIRINSEDAVEDTTNLVSEILQVLEERGVKEGYLTEVLRGPFPVFTWFAVALGVPPVSGTDAIVRYLPISDRKPTLTSDGKTDFYEMHFIDEVNVGDWLGEKIKATEGTPGKTVTGKILPAMRGKDQPLRFDPKTVRMQDEGDRVTLYSLIEGALEWKNGRIGILHRLTIEGDVGVGTGNIEFSGSIIITGTVQDTFSVIADYDISIMSPLGVGAIDKIISRNGDIYIKGGVYGQGKAHIEAKGSVFVKHANDCSIKAGHEIHIGYYAMGSDLSADIVALDRNKGKLIGGRCIAQSQVIAAFIGTEYERPTHVSVEGFDRKEIQSSRQALIERYQEVKRTLDKVMRIVEAYESVEVALEDSKQIEHANALITRDHLQGELLQLESWIKAKTRLLTVRGEGEVSISKMAFPKTFLAIKDRTRSVEKAVKGTFYVDENQMHFE